MCPKITSEAFKLKDTSCYDLHYTLQFSTDPVHSVYNGMESVSYLGSKIWEQIPAEIKNKESCVEFKREIKTWKPIEGPCRICWTFIPNLGFI